VAAVNSGGEPKAVQTLRTVWLRALVAKHLKHGSLVPLCGRQWNKSGQENRGAVFNFPGWCFEA